ncbi:MAG: hypothetical protein QXY36_02185 [Sulfolobales archaeon]
MSEGNPLHVIVEKAIEMYNRLRGVESQARLIELRKDGTLVVEFSGTFCMSCGVVDWVEDLAYVIKSMGLEAKLVEYIEPEGPDVYFKRLGIFKVYPLSSLQDELK